jgi:predicted small integral membrane protein
MNFDFSWMAWTWPTAAFFVVIALLLIGMGVWEYFSPGGNPRVGILRFETTRGDRLFVSLLGAAFIHIAWLGLSTLSLWWALGLAVVYAIGVFRFV